MLFNVFALCSKAGAFLMLTHPPYVGLNVSSKNHTIWDEHQMTDSECCNSEEPAAGHGLWGLAPQFGGPDEMAEV